MNEIEDYEALVELAQSQRDDKSRLRGSLDVIKKNLKNNGFSNLAEAKKGLQKKELLLKSKLAKRSKMMETFKEKYGKFL